MFSSPLQCSKTKAITVIPSPTLYDDDDNDICPVCDGECACDNKPQSAAPTAPLSMSQLASRSHLPPKPLLPSLKIKLTVPQSMLGKRRAPPSKPDLIPKRRGRPPKALVPHAPKQNQQQQPFRPPLKKKSKPAPKRRRVVSSDEEDDELSDIDDPRFAFNDEDDDDDDDDGQSSVQFPTFVSASALSSRASDSSADSSDLSSFDSDSSIEAEEENFIVSEINGRDRARREHHPDDSHHHKKRDAWVIRPRKKSVGPSDGEMDVDSDATVDDEDEEADDEPTAALDDEDTDDRATGSGYVGVATGWSEDDDESSFDADLFFANLSDDSDDRDASSTDHEAADDADLSDNDESMAASLTSLPSMPPELEVTEGWDGQIVFTNGLREGQGMLDMDFEAHAASLAETSPSPSQDSDVEMSSEVDDGGYEEDADEGDGETTDEELVGDDDLPNERAMRLFNLPMSVSAINPMSTMSPAVSPGPRARRPFGIISCSGLDSPKPADILSGKVFWDSDDHDDYEDAATRSFACVSSTPGAGPRKGHFVAVKETRQAIIDDSHKDVPSPHPRFRGRRKPSFSHFRTVEHLLQRHLEQSPITICSPLDDPITMSPEMAGAELVDLNDVLEAAFLDTEPSDAHSASTDTDARKGFKRWDLISVGAFRHSREAADPGSGWGSDSPAAPADYGSMMKSSPLSTMLWQNKAGPAGRRRSRKMSVVISPVILPVRDHRDGDRTPTTTHAPYHAPPLPPPPLRHDHYPHKSRKELRRERKLKRKSYGPVHHAHQHHHHHTHHHHPNSKSRSTSAVQRGGGFFMSSVPPLNL
ncbi:hypothetical protein H0H81_003820 [Sphagnurus paluster]|uniref:Uncharacterized protein n=1 Tax=Sphagnurus paluster TaxID=117069 RepID=A0A9P7GPD3_9AGAR|nr:hypothetical protein H0H81_003820 [Sphagnurus paluster]